MHLGQRAPHKRQLVTIRDATILEQSYCPKNPLNRGSDDKQQLDFNNNSFEILFDSAEFDEQYLEEGYKPDYQHEFSHNQNFIPNS